ncbi:MAG: hydrogenase nickel incorporation protein HypB, partial [Desulfotomaculales bacterium]
VMARRLLQANALRAAEVRALLEEKGVVAVNLIGSPGAGKTALLEKTIPALAGSLPVGVIEGDLYTVRDATRIAGCGAAVVQVNTGGICHLTAAMVGEALKNLPLDATSLIFIENVGNLVCPAAFDLGEHHKVAVLSVTEGNDKPAKYPEVFRTASAAVITKVDLLPHTDFDLAACQKELHDINPGMAVFLTSARNGAGIAGWCEWLKGLVPVAARQGR